MGNLGRVVGGIGLACVACLVVSAAAAQEGKAGGAPRTDRVQALEEQVRRQQDRIQALEAEATFERRRAEAVAAYANRRVADAIASTEHRARETAADLEQLRAEYEREVGALQRLYEDATRRASNAEQAGWIWGAVALLIGIAGGWFGLRRRDTAGAPEARRVFTPGEFAAFLSRRQASDRTVT